uniref:Restriction endonuclease n=1 Tax=Marseillevirus sp. TaxID=2809551 RepID=A0AA96ERX5_9VIRU|nr:restriction endonuclease [Marseillevirus sp.]
MDCESRTRGRLCGEKECKPCFKRSFASSDKVKYLKEGQGNPLLIAKNCNEKFSFVCGECGHDFEVSLNDISNGKFCPFCSNRRLCESNECERCFEKSFASSNKAEFWNFEKNKKSPREVFISSGKKYWFECGKCKHSFDAILNNVAKGCFCPFCSNRRLCSSDECKMCFEKSFASHDKAEFWSVEKNKQRPREVTASSHKKFWFKCGKCEHSFEAGLNKVSIGRFCPFCSSRQLCSSDECKTCFGKSFASSDKAEFWDLEKNKKSPREAFLSSTEQFWFRCGKCEHSFEARLDKVSGGHFCPFCSSRQLCLSDECKACFGKSFASSVQVKFWSFDKNKQKPRDVFASSGKKYWFECGKCKHLFGCGLNNISKGKFCPFCSNSKLCSSSECSICFEKSFASSDKAEFWSVEKNCRNPRDVFANSHKKFWFECEKKHKFSSVLYSISAGRWCPKCKHKTEAKLFSFLKENFEEPIHQFRVPWCKSPETDRELPFDFCVSKTIIELDGVQHYKQVSNWKSPEEQQKTDRYKEEQANKNGYSVLRILQEDVWNDKLDWKNLLLGHVKDYDEPIVKNLWE